LSALGTALSLLLAGCGGSSGTSQSGGSGGKTIPIGAELALSGRFATFGAGVLQGMQAAAKVVNDAGGPLDGRKIKLYTGDSASDPVDSVPPAARLVNVNHVVAEIGIAGGEAEAVVRTYSQAQVPMLTPGGDVFFDKNTNPYVWRMTPSDSQLGVGMAVEARHQNYKTAALLFTSGDVAQGLRPVTESAFTKLGGKVVDTENIQPGLTSYKSEVSHILAAHPDVIFSEMDPATASVIFKNFASAGQLNIPIIGTDTFHAAEMTKAIGVAASVKVLSNIEGGLFDSPAVPIFKAAVQAQSGKEPAANSSYGYDGVIITALAIAQAKSATGPAINAAIPQVTQTGGTVVNSFAEGLALIKAGKRVTYVGASGPFNYNENHNVYGPFIAVKLVSADTYKTLYTMTADELAAASK
jgi:branched-chain amino acid transport system substrate-binding protein